MRQSTVERWLTMIEKVGMEQNKNDDQKQEAGD